MTDTPSELPADDAAPYVPLTPGAELRMTREAHGLGIDDVAMQLKLAPRQVQALEDDDFAKLPGRTFVRGFVRNYARFLGLDPDDLVARLPDANVAPALERPALGSSGRPMGELRLQSAPRRRLLPFVIPFVLIAIVAAAVYYEYRHDQAESRPGDAGSAATSRGGDPAAGGIAPSGAAALPNPLSGGTGTEAGGGTGGAAADTAATAPAAAASTAPVAGAALVTPGGPSPAPGGTVPAAAGGPTAPATGPATASGGSTTTTGTSAAPATGAAATTEPMLVLTFRASSWAQVKDGTGTTLLAMTVPAGSTQAVSGTTPLEVTLGNAAAVAVTYRGRPVDVAPFVRGNVARFALK